jgi:hypothetical protein
MIDDSCFGRPSRYNNSTPVCDGEAALPPGTSCTVNVLVPPMGTPDAGTPVPTKRGRLGLNVMFSMASLARPVK